MVQVWRITDLTIIGYFFRTYRDLPINKSNISCKRKKTNIMDLVYTICYVIAILIVGQ